MRKVFFFLFILLFSTVVSAQNGAMNPVVAPDGTILVMRSGVTATTQASPALVAISRTGVTLWTWEGVARMHTIAFDATQVFLTSATRGTPQNGSQNGGMMGGRGMLRGGADSIVALSVANGTERWRREFAGAVAGLQVSEGRLYVVVQEQGGATPRGGMSAVASLVALDAATGTVIWTTSMQ